MADYRDELRAAHERIAQLEGRLPPPPKKNLARPIGAVALTASALGVVAFFFVSAPLREAPPQVALAVEVAPPPLGMSWYPQPLVAPLLVDIDQPRDGKKEIIGLVWNAGNDAAALNVVALDRDSLAVRWRAGPFPAHWSSDLIHLMATPERVVVTDSRGNVHILDLHTGRVAIAPVTFAEGAQYGCSLRDGSPRVLLNARHEPEAAMALDVTTGRLSRAPKGHSCGLVGHRDRPCVGGATEVPCELPADKSLDARVGARLDLHGFWSTEVLAAGDDRVALGYIGQGNGSMAIAIGLDPTLKSVRWSTRLMPEGDRPDRRRMTGLAPLSVLADGRLLYLYQSANALGQYRLVGRSAASGGILYEVEVPRSAEGSIMSSLSVDGGDAFVIMNQTLHIFDAATGASKKSLASL